MAYKRKRISTPRRYGNKKRRTMRRSSYKRSRGPSTYTSLNTTGHAFGFRTRKTSRRAFKKHLWDSTLFKNHWRSVRSVGDTIATAAGDVDAALVIVNMERFTTADPFWTVTGGLLSTDTGDAPPLFEGDIVLRGGVYSITFSCGSDIRIKSWMVYTNNLPTFLNLPTTIPVAWDPTADADFANDVGRAYGYREVLLESGNHYTYNGRYKLQKIDQNTQAVEGKSFFMLFTISNVGVGAVANVRITRSYNLSFSGDAIGTT